jgi:predicted NBD/HSP70 family sugar kinase
LGLTRATAGNVVGVLLEEGLLRELAQPPDQSRVVGRPGILVTLNPDGAYFIGVDASSAWITGAIVDLGGKVLNKVIAGNSGNFQDPKAVAAMIADVARRLVVGAGVNPRKVRGVGVSVPGIVDRAGVVVSSKNLGWEDVNIAELVAASLGAPWRIRICNDAVALAAAIGALDSHESKEVLVILMSEGLGAAIIRNGRIIEGAGGFAGEIGHMVLSASPEDAKSRTLGILGGYKPFLPLLRGGQSIAEGLAELAAQVEPNASLDGTLIEWASILSVGILNLIHVLNPEHIVVGGPLAVFFPRVRDSVEAMLRPNLLHGLKLPPIEVAGFDADTVAIGAAGAMRDDLFLLPELDHAAAGALDEARVSNGHAGPRGDGARNPTLRT